MKNSFLKWLLGFLLKMDWRKVIYELYAQTIRPELKKLVESTENKFDDKALESLDYLVDKFFKV